MILRVRHRTAAGQCQMSAWNWTSSVLTCTDSGHRVPQTDSSTDGGTKWIEFISICMGLWSAHRVFAASGQLRVTHSSVISFIDCYKYIPTPMLHRPRPIDKFSFIQSIQFMSENMTCILTRRRIRFGLTAHTNHHQWLRNSHKFVTYAFDVERIWACKTNKKNPKYKSTQRVNRTAKQMPLHRAPKQPVKRRQCESNGKLDEQQHYHRWYGEPIDNIDCDLFNFTLRCRSIIALFCAFASALLPRVISCFPFVKAPTVWKKSGKNTLKKPKRNFLSEFETI